MGWTYTWTRCPYCHTTLTFSSRRGTFPESQIGRTQFSKCKNCGKNIANGKKEWPEMTILEKILEIIRFGFISIFGALFPAIFSIIPAVFLSTKLEFLSDNVIMLFVIGVPSVTFLILLFLGIKSSVLIISNSIKRHEQDELPQN